MDIKSAMNSMTKKEIGAVISAWTGMLCGEFSDMHEYIEKIMKGPIFTHELGSKDMMEEIKKRSEKDFIEVIKILHRDYINEEN